MPNRIVREGILTSERVNALTTNAEVFYRRLLSVVDDFGRYSANPTLLRAHCYPLKLDSVKEDSIKKHLAECSDAGLIVLYTVAGKGAYLEVQDFGQQIRATKSKYPSPAEQSPSECVADAKQPIGNAHLVVSVDVSEGVSEDGPRKRGSRLPKPFEFSPGWGEAAGRLGASPDLVAREFPKFCDHWWAQSGQRGVKDDWDATWRNWIRKAIEWSAKNGSKTNRVNPSLAERAAEAERLADEHLGSL